MDDRVKTLARVGQTCADAGRVEDASLILDRIREEASRYDAELLGEDLGGWRASDRIRRALAIADLTIAIALRHFADGSKETAVSMLHDVFTSVEQLDPWEGRSPSELEKETAERLVAIGHAAAEIGDRDLARQAVNLGFSSSWAFKKDVAVAMAEIGEIDMALEAAQTLEYEWDRGHVHRAAVAYCLSKQDFAGAAALIERIRSLPSAAEQTGSVRIGPDNPAVDRPFDQAEEYARLVASQVVGGLDRDARSSVGQALVNAGTRPRRVGAEDVVKSDRVEVLVAQGNLDAAWSLVREIKLEDLHDAARQAVIVAQARSKQLGAALTEVEQLGSEELRDATLESIVTALAEAQDFESALQVAQLIQPRPDTGLEDEASDGVLRYRRALALTRIAEKQARAGEYRSAVETAEMIDARLYWRTCRAYGLMARAAARNGDHQVAELFFGGAIAQPTLEPYDTVVTEQRLSVVGVLVAEALKDVAIYEAEVGEFSSAIQLATTRIDHGVEQVKALATIAIEQALAGAQSDATETLKLAESVEISGFQAKFQAEGLGALAEGYAYLDDTRGALRSLASIHDSQHRLPHVAAASRAAFRLGDERTAADFAQQMSTEEERAHALESITIELLKVGRPREAARLAETIMSDRERHLVMITSAMIDDGCLSAFKEFLLPCAHYYSAVVGMCRVLAHQFPESRDWYHTRAAVGAAESQPSLELDDLYGAASTNATRQVVVYVQDADDQDEDSQELLRMLESNRVRLIRRNVTHSYNTWIEWLRVGNYCGFTPVVVLVKDGWFRVLKPWPLDDTQVAAVETALGDFKR